jgi:hypothetical protein
MAITLPPPGLAGTATEPLSLLAASVSPPLNTTAVWSYLGEVAAGRRGLSRLTTGLRFLEHDPALGFKNFKLPPSSLKS